jgi:hypothetical protein
MSAILIKSMSFITVITRTLSFKVDVIVDCIRDVVMVYYDLTWGTLRIKPILVMTAIFVEIRICLKGIFNCICYHSLIF